MLHDVALLLRILAERVHTSLPRGVCVSWTSKTPGLGYLELSGNAEQANSIDALFR